MKAFGDPKFEPAQQGELDALCGVYVVTNFISRRLLLAEDCSERWDHFQMMLTKLAAGGKFTVSSVGRDGFKNGQIQAAFNKVAPEIELNVRAKNLASVMRKRGTRTLWGLLSTLDQNEAAMIRVDDEGHWILMHSAKDGRFKFDDSYPPARCGELSKTAKRLANADLENGLVFLNA